MAQFSPYVIKALTDVITGGVGQGPDIAEPIGIYRSGPNIERFFMDCGLDMRIGASSRLPATMDFLRQIAGQWDADEKLKRVIQKVSDPREYLSDPTRAIAVQEHLNAALAADGLAVTTVNGKAEVLPRGTAGVVVTAFTETVTRLDFDTVQLDISRALKSATEDPEDAVTSACSLVEAVCRSILIELGLPLPAKKDIDGLIRAVQEPLGLSPGRSGLPPEIENDIRQILSGLTSVAKGIGALRTHAGDAHGRERGHRRIDARIARLAINAASSLALFLIETWELKQHRTLLLKGTS
ncbi:abortive infection family protein [Rhizobium sp. S-51]|uniref:Abortive infection family protein n=1 Tax=Rhizobium terricola TaxID=2728849 RepID=A0A7Y0FXT4_9HYPH|nr:abortive infection family protein [Rhizobium terricola]NML76261.1 abortive infection family protein [Rhizobium terricola]